MRAQRLAAVLALAACGSLVASPARADDPVPSASSAPSRGTAGIVGGPIFMGLGVAGLGAGIAVAATQTNPPLCQQADSTCVGEAVVFTAAGVLLVGGTVLLVVGVNQRKAFNAWMRAHPLAAGFEVRGTGVGWHVTF
jgi:hypothetical protein